LEDIKNMANITGTEGADTLRGTNIDPLAPPNDFGSGGDTINALGGDDLIIGSTGSDTIDGGAGNDTIDFSNIGQDLFLFYSGAGLDTVDFQRRYPPSPSENFVFTSTRNIETFIGDPSKSNTINDSSRYPYNGGDIDVDLSTGRVIYGAITYTVKNFDNIRLRNNSGRLVGNDRDNKILGGSRSVIVGSKGNDELTGDTIDYSNLGRTIKFSTSGIVDKGDFGKDKLKVGGFQTIIGATNKANTLDASSGASLNLNLANNSPNYFRLTNADGSVGVGVVINFVNAIGTNGNDTIVGANKNSTLTGGGGNDSITGGSKNDRLTGTDSTARGVGEVDTLTGGGGRDKFILGDKNGAYYVGNGSNDYATITDFNLFQDSIDLGSLKNYSFALEGTNTIDLFSGKDVNTRDLVAKIQIAGGISSVASNSRSIAGASPNLDSIISKIDVLSGTASSDS
jgi:Ca2+-binding RTX toxin-like protein